MPEAPITCRFFDPSAAGVADGAIQAPDFPFNRALSYDSCRCPVLCEGAPVVACALPDNQPDCGYYEAGVEVVLWVAGEYEIVLTRTYKGLGYYEVIHTDDRRVIAAAHDEETAVSLAAAELGLPEATFNPPKKEKQSYLASLIS